MGVTGDKGEMGTDGEEGAQGARGVDGQDGSPGAPGLQGADGLNGTTGDKGEPAVGLPGPAGPPGPPGSASGKPFFGGELNTDSMQVGSKGEKGETGKPGTVDLNDFTDLIPLFQEKGDKGDEGVKGDNGGCKMCVGFKGSRGRRGQRGIKGIEGVLGPKGELGAPGFPGQNGIPGAPGTPGDAIKGERGDSTSCECTGNSDVKGEKGEPGVIVTNNGSEYKVIEGPPGPPGTPGKSTVGPQGPRGVPGRGSTSSFTSGSTLGNIVMYPNQLAMTGSSLAIPSGTLGFVMDQQRLYIRVNMGWQALTVGPVIPMNDGEFANSLPSFLQEKPLFGDAAAASSATEITGMVRPKLRMYALNTPLGAGDIVGVSGADFMCYKQARAAKVSGTFRAVLASRQQTIDSLVFHKDQDLSVVNSQGDVVLESWSGVTKDKGYWTRGVSMYTFDGIDITKDERWSSRYFWHGARSTGEVDSSAYCQAWTSASRSELGVSSSYMDGQVLDSSLHTCDSQLAVFCIETTLPDIYRQR